MTYIDSIKKELGFWALELELHLCTTIDST